MVTDQPIGIELRAQIQEICDNVGVSIREYVEALLNAKEEAIRVASEEREKAASALRDQLTERIATGDLNLREHITAQISQLRQMVEGGDRLELARFDAIQDKVDQLNQAGHTQIEQRIAGVQREVALVQGAAQTAISKAEESTNERFRNVNEFRAQLADQTSSFMPREVYQTAHDQLIARVAALERLAQFGEGRQKGVGVTAGVLATVAGIAVAFLGLLVVLANYISAH